MGSSMEAKALLKDFLIERFKRVNVNGVCFHWIEFKRGVPQATVLDPSISMIYKNYYLMNVLWCNIQTTV